MHSTPETDRPSPAPFWCLTTLWMLVLVVCFTIQQVVIVHMGKAYDAYLALSGYGMKSGHLWELFTCHLLHCGLVHLLVNLVGLWFLGRAVEAHFGSRRFLVFCLGASLAGAVLQGGVALTGFLLPESLESVAGFVRERFGGPVSGSSISLCAILAAFCLVRPERIVCRRFVVPVKAAHLLWPALGVAVLFIIVPSNPDLAHIAHLGGMLAAIAMIRGGFNRCPIW
jgi:membrane associated rhomboid family serine protease